MITDLGITQDQFVNACEEADKKEEYKKYLDIILSADDFLKFKEMMVKRNMRLNEKALKFSYYYS
jgi:hypothetical protein